jgi:MYB-related transcription factor LHY
VCQKQDLTTARLPDYTHLAPKLTGNEGLDATVAAVAQAASAAAAAAAAAVISAAGDHVRAHMQVRPEALHLLPAVVLLHRLCACFVC